jgi:hypothetical protein
MSDAKSLFENLVRQIDSDCTKKNCSDSLALCQASGMQGGRRSGGGMGEHFIYELDFDNGDRVEFDFKWYDRSQAFSIRPDVHRFTVTYKPSDGMPLSHSNAYEQ